MRRAITQRVASFISPTAKCHQPFRPTAVGSYLVKKCYECGEAVPVEENIRGGAAFVIQVRDPKEKT